MGGEKKKDSMAKERKEAPYRPKPGEGKGLRKNDTRCAKFQKKKEVSVGEEPRGRRKEKISLMKGIESKDPFPGGKGGG